jgi:signal transduction histidine kinase
MRRLSDRRQWRERAYLLLGLPLGALWFGLIVALYLSGIAAQFLLIGVVFLTVAQLLLRPIGRFERFLVGGLLGGHVPAPEPLRFRRSAGRWWAPWLNLGRRSAAAFLDGHSWRVLAWTLLRFVIGPLGFVLVTVEVLLPLVLVAAPFAVVVAGLTGVVPAHLRWLYAVALAPVLLPLLIPVQASISTLADLLRRAARRALGPGPRELEAAALARAEAAEEQVRIDQELHDSIGHMLSMIVVQAGAGAHVFDTDPAFARSALRTIEERGRAALGELDRIIATFREGTPEAAHPDGDAVAVPRGDDLASLLSDAAEAGMQVTARLQLGQLPDAVGRGIYRIVQEALSNAARHAPGSPVTVEVATDSTAVVVSVTNQTLPDPDSPRPGPSTRSRLRRPGGGRGLASIRDRAGLLGGVATAGAIDDGGFAVRVVLPLAARLPDGVTARCSLARDCSCLGCEIRRTVLR